MKHRTICQCVLVLLLLGSWSLPAQMQQIGEPQVDSFPEITVKISTRNPVSPPADFYSVMAGDTTLDYTLQSSLGQEIDRPKTILIIWELLSYAERKKQNAYFREFLTHALPSILQPGDKVNVAVFAWTDLEEDSQRTLAFLHDDFTDDITLLVEKVAKAEVPGGKGIQPNHGSELYPALKEGVATLAPIKDRARVLVSLSAEFHNIFKADGAAMVIANAREADVAVYNYRYKLKDPKYNLDEVASSTYGLSYQVDPEDAEGSAEVLTAHMESASERAAGMVHSITFSANHSKDGALHQVQIVGGTESITVPYTSPDPSTLEWVKENMVLVIVTLGILVLLIIGLILLMRKRSKTRKAQLEAQERKISSLAEQGEEAEGLLKEMAELRQKEEAIKRRAEQETRKKEADKELERIRKEMFSAGKSPRLSVFLNEGSEVIELSGPVVVLGRAAEADIVIDHNTISRMHAQVIYDEGVYRITDLGSTNGTFHNGNRVEGAVLKHGDTISLGDVRIMFYI